jgi:predicted transposase/invertase (TIGR01784 family)
MEPREKYVNVFFTREELTSNEDGKKFYGDIKNCMDTAFKEGKEAGKKEGLKQGELKGKLEGKIEGKIEVAKNALKSGLPISMISSLTRLTEEEIENLN